MLINRKNDDLKKNKWFIQCLNKRRAVSIKLCRRLADKLIVEK